MKIKILLLTILLAGKIVHGQTVVSSCVAPDSIVKTFKDDADRLTVRRINAIHATYQDSVKIPKAWSDTVLKALIAVYNATTLPARNTVVGLNIHTFPTPSLTDIDVSADSNLFWMHQLRSNIIPTGFSSLDSLISMYNLHVAYYHDYSHLLSFHTVSFQSDSNYNLSPLTTIFDSLNGVTYSSLGSTVGDGNDITDSILPTYVKLIYSYGWNDCPAGCIFKHYWEFKVYYDCSVEFVGEYGSPYSGTNIQTNNKPAFSVHPNPFSSKITVDNNASSYEYYLINSYGQIIRRDKTNASEILHLDDLPTGVYALHLTVDNVTKTIKLVKN